MGHTDQVAGSPKLPRARWGGFWASRPRALQALTVVALLWITVYLTWRVGWSLQDANPWLWAALLAAELYGAWNLLMLSWFGWRIRPPERPPATPGRSVDVYVCTYDEREENAEADRNREYGVQFRLLRVESTVAWRASDGRDRDVRLATLLLAGKP